MHLDAVASIFGKQLLGESIQLVPFCRVDVEAENAFLVPLSNTAARIRIQYPTGNWLLPLDFWGGVFNGFDLADTPHCSGFSRAVEVRE